MENLQQEIANTFFEELKESPNISPAILDQLRVLLSSDKKIKADDLVNIFSPPPIDDIK
jgi:hypothetical protein